MKRRMKCLCSSEQIKTEYDAVRSSNSINSSQNGEGENNKIDTGNIEEAESSLREGGCLNYEEARALLGRLEYQRGNIEAALRVFDGIDFGAVIPKIKASIARKSIPRKYGSNNYTPMSMHAISLLFEAIFLKAKSLEKLGRFKEAAKSCSSILDTVESAFPGGLPENFGMDSKLQEMIERATELLPELWKSNGLFQEAILAYRKALLYRWNLDSDTMIRIQKDFAVFLLYSGGDDGSPPNLRFQLEGSYIPRNNTEEAILLLMILLRKFVVEKSRWDPCVIDHLIFALSVSGDLGTSARQIEGLLPRVMDRREQCYALALCYFGEGDNMASLDLLRKIATAKENPTTHLKALLLASKICGEKNPEEGVFYARRALKVLKYGCDQIESVARFLLGISLSAATRSSPSSNSRRSLKQFESLKELEVAEKLTKNNVDANIIYHLGLENADKRMLDAALHYTKLSLKLECGSDLRSWILLVQILSAQKRFVDAEISIDAALEQTGRWNQGKLLRLKAKIQISRGKLRNAVETYTRILAVLQLKAKNSRIGGLLLKGDGDYDRTLETDTWHALANLYIRMSQWDDAEVCLSKSKAINPFSASWWHTKGKLYESKGLPKEALRAYHTALEIEDAHAPSLISAAIILNQLGDHHQTNFAIIRGFLTDALRIDRTNPEAWYHLGLLHKSEAASVGGGARSSMEAAECFQASALLEETAPVEDFRL